MLPTRFCFLLPSLSSRAMSASNSQGRERGLTLEDYLAHQRTLRTLQRPQPVWIVDDLLGLRYHARLQLRLHPTRHLLLTDGSTSANEAHDEGVCADLTSPAARSSAVVSSLVIPLTPACQVDVCASMFCDDERGLRLTLPSSLSEVQDDSDGVLTGAEASFIVLPIAHALGTSSASLAVAWAAVLRLLCQSTRDRHADPRVTTPCTPVRAASTHISGASSTARKPVNANVVQTSAGAVTAATSLCSNSTTTHDAPPEPLETWRGRQSGEPLPVLHCVLHADCSMSHQSNSNSDNDNTDAAAAATENRRLSSLTAALRSSTQQAAQLAEHLRGSLSPARTSPSQSSHADVETSSMTDLDLDPDPDRPPTMAHASNGLIPALNSSHFFPSIISSEDEEEDDEAAGVGSEDVGGREEDQDGVLTGADVMVDIVGGGSYTNLADALRPPAPRSGHVCNLGSIGPSCGDEEALRMYNEIHGSRSSSSTSRVSVATSSDGHASPFLFSAYGAENVDASKKAALPTHECAL